MTLNDFLERYRFNYIIDQPTERELVVKTQVIRRENESVAQYVTTTFDTHETDSLIADSQGPFSAISWSWEKLIEDTKRMQLDYFAMRVPIDDFFPRDTTTDISFLL